MGEQISTRAAYGMALAEFGGSENIYVFDADLKSCTMTQYFAEKYPDRFFNMGIAEANMVDVAAGFATCGAIALVNTFAIFASGRVYDQVRNDVVYPGLNVKVVGSHAGLTVGEDGATH
ncbi:MAG: transketolase family protein, partial [Porcincola intestinalis]|nr:transketolase family protein [Porcincola intestinalis]